MSKPTIFTISAVWDEEASVWSGHCDDIPAAADASTLDELLAKITAMALDVLPDNHPEADPASHRHSSLLLLDAARLMATVEEARPASGVPLTFREIHL